MQGHQPGNASYLWYLLLYAGRGKTLDRTAENVFKKIAVNVGIEPAFA
jgi:hypothetical protein